MRDEDVWWVHSEEFFTHSMVSEVTFGWVMVDHSNLKNVLLNKDKHSWVDGWNVDQPLEEFPLVCSFTVELTCFIGIDDDDVVGFSSALVSRGGMGGGRGTVVEFFLNSLSINEFQSSKPIHIHCFPTFDRWIIRRSLNEIIQTLSRGEIQILLWWRTFIDWWNIGIFSSKKNPRR